MREKVKIRGGIIVFWNQQVEMLSRADMAAWQSYKVEKAIERVYEKSAFYKNRMIERGILPENITSLDDSPCACRRMLIRMKKK